ncbi:MAG: SsrA-binding protein [Calditrichaeota bacterium]|nr:SsrA-binding protein [Calditrichota bacterium]
MAASTPEIRNRKAFHDYHISERLEAGIALSGTEVKSVRAGRVSMRDAYVDFTGREPLLIGLSIAAYENRGYADHGVFRPRKLLMHRREIKQWKRQVQEKGYTAIPLRVYFNDRGYAKVELGLAKGKRQYDKRKAIAARDAEREVERVKKEMQSWNR